MSTTLELPNPLNMTEIRALASYYPSLMMVHATGGDCCRGHTQAIISPMIA
jgi:hypothetical protein